MQEREVPHGGRTWTVHLDGPESQHVVVALPDAQDTPDDFAEVFERLHNSGLRTIFLAPAPGLDDRIVPGLLGALALPMVNLVGRGAGADLAWQVAAREFDRFLSLVVLGRGHPAAPDPAGTVRDRECRPVELPTTGIVGEDPAQRRWADVSGRYVYGDYRVVGVPGYTDLLAEAPREIATEIVLRTSLW
jgi:hypothetical protein